MKLKQYSCLVVIAIFAVCALGQESFNLHPVVHGHSGASGEPDQPPSRENVVNGKTTKQLDLFKNLAELPWFQNVTTAWKAYKLQKQKMEEEKKSYEINHQTESAELKKSIEHFILKHPVYEELQKKLGDLRHKQTLVRSNFDEYKKVLMAWTMVNKNITDFRKNFKNYMNKEELNKIELSEEELKQMKEDYEQRKKLDDEKLKSLREKVEDLKNEKPLSLPLEALSKLEPWMTDEDIESIQQNEGYVRQISQTQPNPGQPSPHQRNFDQNGYQAVTKWNHQFEPVGQPELTTPNGAPRYNNWPAPPREVPNRDRIANPNVVPIKINQMENGDVQSLESPQIIPNERFGQMVQAQPNITYLQSNVGPKNSYDTVPDIRIHVDVYTPINEYPSEVEQNLQRITPQSLSEMSNLEDFPYNYNEFKTSTIPTRLQQMNNNYEQPASIRTNVTRDNGRVGQMESTQDRQYTPAYKVDDPGVRIHTNVRPEELKTEREPISIAVQLQSTTKPILDRPEEQSLRAGPVYKFLTRSQIKIAFFRCIRKGIRAQAKQRSPQGWKVFRRCIAKIRTPPFSKRQQKIYNKLMGLFQNKYNLRK